MCDTTFCNPPSDWERAGFTSYDAYFAAMTPVWDAEDKRNEASERDQELRVPTYTRDLVALLNDAGVPAYVEGMGGGCEAIVAPLGYDRFGYWDDCLLIGDTDAGLPYIGSPIVVTRYGHDVDGDHIDHTPVLETDYPLSVDVVAALAIATYRDYVKTTREPIPHRDPLAAAVKALRA